MRQQDVLKRATQLDNEGHSKAAVRLLATQIDAGRADTGILRKFAYILMRDGREVEYRERFVAAQARWRKDNYLLGLYADTCFLLDDLDEAKAAYEELIPRLAEVERQRRAKDLAALNNELARMARRNDSLFRARVGLVTGLALTGILVAGLWVIVRRGEKAQ